ncbi:MAG: hypothetical protein ACLGSH_13385 [Acidobacteriota bacterium]
MRARLRGRGENTALKAGGFRGCENTQLRGGVLKGRDFCRAEKSNKKTRALDLVADAQADDNDAPMKTRTDKLMEADYYLASALATEKRSNC